MKGKLIYSVLLAVLAACAMSFGLFGCKSSVEPLLNEEPQSELLERLSEYNSEVILENPVTKGIFAKMVAVMGADFVAGYTGFKAGAEGGFTIGTAIGHPATGAIVGGVLMGGICAAGASILANRAMSTKAIPSASDISTDEMFDQLYLLLLARYSDLSEVLTSQLDQNPMANELSLPTQAKMMGALHNELISCYFDGLCPSEESADLSSRIGLLTYTEKSILRDASLKRQIKSRLREYNSSRNYFLIRVLPDRVMQYFYDLLENTEFDSEQLVGYINMYHSIVEDSQELTSQEKDCIYTGLAISLFSYNYWKEHGEY